MHNVFIKSMIAYSLLDWNSNFNFLRNLNEREIQEASALLALLENILVNVMVEDKRIWKLNPSRIFSCKSFFDKLIDE